NNHPIEFLIVLDFIDSLPLQRQNATGDVDTHIVCCIQSGQKPYISTPYAHISISF
ncbi:MAG: hypothetical protein ACI810_002146, partial [Gammaproteobacteria bacterium]